MVYSMVFCVKCGKELEGEANFCLQCGVRTLKGETEGIPIPQDWLTSGLSQLGKELEIAFKEAVDNYLEACKKLKQKPNKPYSGNLMLRIPVEVHAAVAAAAEASGKSINQWAKSVLETASNVH